MKNNLRIRKEGGETIVLSVSVAPLREATGSRPRGWRVRQLGSISPIYRP